MQFAGMVFRLAFTPCLVESITVAIASHYLLGLPWLWGFMLGFVLAAVSPGLPDRFSSFVCLTIIHSIEILKAPNAELAHY
jgi:NhaP-type Na+/H+ and K+/H+ antiporter